MAKEIAFAKQFGGTNTRIDTQRLEKEIKLKLREALEDKITNDLTICGLV